MGEGDEEASVTGQREKMECRGEGEDVSLGAIPREKPPARGRKASLCGEWDWDTPER